MTVRFDDLEDTVEGRAAAMTRIDKACDDERSRYWREEAADEHDGFRVNSHITAFRKALTEQTPWAISARTQAEAAQRQQEQKLKRAELVATEQAASEAAFATRKQELRSAYLAAGGNPEAFEQRWPDLKLELLAQDINEQNNQARAATRRHYAQAY